MATLVTLNNGIMLWTLEDMATTPPDRFITFETKFTAAIAMVKTGQFQIIKLSDDIGKPEKIIYPISAVQSIRDCKDEELNKQCRAALSGLILAK